MEERTNPHETAGDMACEHQVPSRVGADVQPAQVVRAEYWCARVSVMGAPYFVEEDCRLLCVIGGQAAERQLRGHRSTTTSVSAQAATTSPHCVPCDRNKYLLAECRGA